MIELRKTQLIFVPQEPLNRLFSRNLVPWVSVPNKDGYQYSLYHSLWWNTLAVTLFVLSSPTFLLFVSLYFTTVVRKANESNWSQKTFSFYLEMLTTEQFTPNNHLTNLEKECNSIYFHQIIKIFDIMILRELDGQHILGLQPLAMVNHCRFCCLTTGDSLMIECFRCATQ